ncbi:nucleoside-diphosphate-sugar epimerase [Streptosporangium becharense]|uniref:Nucleoside-diphosphate-sugar epimerase n=1 Tax=Streptosporangium becharense TaxID=1816182 RepID=A0A7W9ICN5_9ACTN|nr:NAD-dependent epimerase/dehydratase family protein [Streptosporangium becharense]MBB2913683.1 nucleoside-diphosphate-sugar epimerase [Streptosporangium becharense]MBB5817764.1 nucleoside-diphosphate-sugar epimerase [Streptosporangium becharense]
MRVVVVGATGNVGTSVVSALAADQNVTSILGLARRLPDWHPPKTTWRTADVVTGDLEPYFAGADAVVHLAWLFQPTRDSITTWRTNVIGSSRVFEAAARAGAGALVHASSVGAYSSGPKDPAVAEDWPTHGWPGASYGREKAYVERLLDVFERDHPGVRVVRMRPGFIFKREAASEQRRLFGGPFLPQRLMRPGLIPFVPDTPGLTFQAVHSADAAEAYRLAVTRPVSGAFNIAADPVITPAVLADLLGARLLPVSAWTLRSTVAAAWRMRLVPASPYLVDLVLRMPVMDTGRARAELGWEPRHTAVEAMRELFEGLRNVDGMDTPPLAPRTGGPGRLGELVTGVGKRP